MYIPIKTMKYFLSEFEQRLQGYSVEKKSTPNGLINIYLLNDSLALLVEIVGRKASLCCNAEEMYGDCRKNPYLGFPIEGETYYTLRIIVMRDLLEKCKKSRGFLSLARQFLILVLIAIESRTGTIQSLGLKLTQTKELVCCFRNYDCKTAVMHG